MSDLRANESKRDLLYSLAAAHGGYFSAREAKLAGVATRVLSYHHERGRISAVFRGVYRLTNFPVGEHEELIVVWLATDQEAIFSHETALALYNLSDVLPNRIHVSLTPSWRRRLLPAGVERHYVKATITQRTWIGDVPVTTPLRTLSDCKVAHVSPEFVLQAIKQARARGLIDVQEANNLASSYGTTIL